MSLGLIMEYWNDGKLGFIRMEAIFNFTARLNPSIFPKLQYPKSNLSNIPTFHLG